MSDQEVLSYRIDADEITSFKPRATNSFNKRRRKFFSEDDPNQKNEFDKTSNASTESHKIPSPTMLARSTYPQGRNRYDNRALYMAVSQQRQEGHNASNGRYDRIRSRDSSTDGLNAVSRNRSMPTTYSSRQGRSRPPEGELEEGECMQSSAYVKPHDSFKRGVSNRFSKSGDRSTGVAARVLGSLDNPSSSSSSFKPMSSVSHNPRHYDSEGGHSHDDKHLSIYSRGSYRPDESNNCRSMDYKRDWQQRNRDDSKHRLTRKDDDWNSGTSEKWKGDERDSESWRKQAEDEKQVSRKRMLPENEVVEVKQEESSHVKSEEDRCKSPHIEKVALSVDADFTKKPDDENHSSSIIQETVTIKKTESDENRMIVDKECKEEIMKSPDTSFESKRKTEMQKLSESANIVNKIPFGKHSAESDYGEEQSAAPASTMSHVIVEGEDSNLNSNQKEKPSFETSGLLARETNMQNGVLMKHVPPLEGRLPTRRWRLYMFKGDSTEDSRVFHLHRKENYLFGKDLRVVDVALHHPTISKQHAAIQYRLNKGNVCPYIIDLESTNSTFLNGNRIPPSRYVELREGDMLRFGRSTREFVLLHTESVDQIVDED